MMNNLLKNHPTIPILAGFLLVILIGTSILKLPGATRDGRISWIDAMFTSTSAVCVTGLTIVDTGSYFTPFGQTVILCLIQIGGLGVMTITVLFFLWIGRYVTYSQRLLVQDLFTHSPRKDIFHLIYSVAIFTFLVEGAGSLALFLHWRAFMPTGQALYHAVFHSVSAFCNAGFCLNPDNMIRFRSDPVTNIVIAGLIILGGLGFPVLYDSLDVLRKRKTRFRLSVQSRVVLTTSLLLILIGAALIHFLSPILQTADISWRTKLLTALFQSITCRTAGFNTIEISTLSDAALMCMIFLMFFGASPGSCGGGVKTTTLAILFAFVLTRLRRQQTVSIFSRSIPEETVKRSMALIILAFSIIFFVLLMILTQKADLPLYKASAEPTLLPYLFECVSAFGTVGLSMGVTSGLSSWGKTWIIVLMIIGRLGVLTFAYLFVGSGKEDIYKFSEENVMIG